MLSTKLDGVEDVDSVLTSDMEVQVGLGLSLAQYLLDMLPSLHFGMEMCILLEICDLLSDFDFYR